MLDYIRMLFERNVPAKEVAAIVVEPLQGEGGYLVPPDGFLQGLRQLCDEHGILLVFDEVQSGIGRTGRMFAPSTAGVTPDIMTLAKGLASGMPIGAVVAKASLMKQWKKGAHGNTFGGNPICCAAANATIDLVREQYAANAARVGAHFMKRLHEMRADYPCIGDIRGRGLMIGVELIETGRRAGARADGPAAAPRLPERPAAADLRRLDAALHAAALRDRGGSGRGDDLPPAEPRRGTGGRGVIRRAGALLALAPFLWSAPAVAAREFVLNQVQLPHGYYWRELYIPQLTTRPLFRGLHAGRRRARLQHGGLAVAAARSARRTPRSS